MGLSEQIKNRSLNTCCNNVFQKGLDKLNVIGNFRNIRGSYWKSRTIDIYYLWKTDKGQWDWKKKQTIKDKHTYKNLKGKNKNKKTQRITKDEGCSMIFAVQYKMEKLISETEKDLLPSSLLNFWEILKLWRLPNQTWKCVANAASEN